jgi:hypothetical protein
MPNHLDIIPNILRIATIEEVAVSPGAALPSVCTIKFDDAERTAEAFLPHPAGVGDQGLFIVPKKGTRVLVGRGDSNRFFIVSYYTGPFLNSISGQSRLGSLSVKSSPPPLSSTPGEVIINGSRGAYSKYGVDGEILSKFGDTGSISLSPSATIGKYAKGAYTSLSSGYHVSGEVRRESEPTEFWKTKERLAGTDFDGALRPIGRDPTLPISSYTSGPNIHRNPPFVEQRSVVYEYARDYLVNDAAIEKNLYKEANPSLGISDLKLERQGSRTDAFGIGPLQYNVLSETLLGTAVDVYKNILDLNRNPIAPEPGASTPDQQISAQYDALRRSIKFHFELNSRKATDSITLDSDNPVFSGGPTGYLADHSRWSIDVDAEGQTKINIPASSSTGNIPVHSRYVSSSFLATVSESDSDLSKTHYMVRNPGSRDSLSSNNSEELRKDIVHYNYSSTSTESGVEIDDKNSPKSQNTRAFRWTMPHHDPALWDILNLKTRISALPHWYPDGSGVSSEQSYLGLLGRPVIPTGALTNSASGYVSSNGIYVSPNAGGRSVSLNLDGSLEMALGADQASGKSAIIDAAGSLIARVGKDSSSNSIVLAADGDTTLVVGASSKSGDAIRIPGGNLKIFVQNAEGGTAAIEIIDGNVHIKSAPNKNIVFESSSNIILSAGHNVLINGERIGFYGKYESDGSKVYGGKAGVGERQMVRNGQVI